jgi:hypothetical protein
MNESVGHLQRFLTTSIGDIEDRQPVYDRQEAIEKAVIARGEPLDGVYLPLNPSQIYLANDMSFRVRIGALQLKYNPESLTNKETFSLTVAKRVGGGPLSRLTQFDDVDFVFVPHRNNWLSSLELSDHETLFRFLFSSTDSWEEDNKAAVHLFKEAEEAFNYFKGKIKGNSDFGIEKILTKSWNEPLIVVEQSPPTLFTLKQLLSTSNGVAIGGFIGGAAAVDHIPLMLVTVPAGMLIVSASVGVSQALQHGLRHRLTALIAGRAETDSPRKAKRTSPQERGNDSRRK